MRVFVTGGAGYIGTHTLVALAGKNCDILVWDNFSNSHPEALRRTGELAGAPIPWLRGDMRDEEGLKSAMRSFSPDAVIHFAGLKAVGLSVSQPLDYYTQNVVGTLNLLRAMDEADCRQIVFSSSATVYGEARYLPFDEAHPLAPINPYGQTKQMAEQILRDWAAASAGRSAILLRYFNPVGAHSSGCIGEDPADIPNNLMPLVLQTATGRRSVLQIFGNDYETRDGTGERDYIHVCDLAEAHMAALDYANRNPGVSEAINIGMGTGITVLELVAALGRIARRNIPSEIAPRRPGDIACSIASPAKARKLLSWEARRDLEDICRSAWRWQSQNPDGYG